MNKKIELETKLWLPIFPADISSAIFGRLLQNPTCTTLGLVARVCKDWQSQLLTIYPKFPEISCIFSRQIIHVPPIMKFLLQIVGDWRESIPYENLMPRAYIRQCIVELEKPCSEVQAILKKIKYAEYAEDANFISMVRSLNGMEKSSDGGEKLSLELGIFLPWRTRVRMWDAIVKAGEKAVVVSMVLLVWFVLLVFVLLLISSFFIYRLAASYELACSTLMSKIVHN